jgi:hypothetical protein
MPEVIGGKGLRLKSSDEGPPNPFMTPFHLGRILRLTKVESIPIVNPRQMPLLGI